MAGFLILLAFLTLVLAGLLYVLYGLKANYEVACRTELPLILLPVDCGNPLWLAVDRKVVQWVCRIPFSSGNFTRFNWRGWEILDRYRAHQQFGDALLLVTPGKNYLQLCNAEAVAEIFQRRADFPRPPEATGKKTRNLDHTPSEALTKIMVEMLNVFGPNLGTVSGSPMIRTFTHFSDRWAPMAKTSQDYSVMLQRAYQYTGLVGKHSSSNGHDSILVVTTLR